jgi:hypothetical protein
VALPQPSRGKCLHAEHVQARGLTGELRQELGGSVRRSVIYRDDLKVWVVLGEVRPHRCRDRLRLVPRSENNAYTRQVSRAGRYVFQTRQSPKAAQDVHGDASAEEEGDHGQDEGEHHHPLGDHTSARCP